MNFRPLTFVENGELLLASMTLEASDGVDIVMMENFNDLTANVDCKGDDGILSMTFKSKEDFDQAVEKWSFVKNTEKQEKFILIANHHGCGPDDERQAYSFVNPGFGSLKAPFH